MSRCCEGSHVGTVGLRWDHHIVLSSVSLASESDRFVTYNKSMDVVTQGTTHHEMDKDSDPCWHRCWRGRNHRQRIRYTLDFVPGGIFNLEASHAPCYSCMLPVCDNARGDQTLLTSTRTGFYYAHSMPFLEEVLLAARATKSVAMTDMKRQHMRVRICTHCGMATRCRQRRRNPISGRRFRLE